MDFTEVKNILGITTEKHDMYFSTVVPLFVDYAKEYTNNSFLDADGNESLPGAVRIFVAKACEFNMGDSKLSSRSMGEVSYSYETDLPDSVMRLLKPYKRVRFS